MYEILFEWRFETPGRNSEELRIAAWVGCKVFIRTVEFEAHMLLTFLKLLAGLYETFKVYKSFLPVSKTLTLSPIFCILKFSK